MTKSFITNVLILALTSTFAEAACKTDALLTTPTFSMQADAASGEGGLLLVLLGSDSQTAPVIEQVRSITGTPAASAAKTTVTFGIPLLETSDPSSNHEWSIWRLPIKVADLQAKTMLQYTFLVKRSNSLTQQTVSITNLVGPPIADKAKTPSGTLLVADGEETQLLYSAGATGASKVGVFQGFLQDSSRKTSIQSSSFGVTLAQFYCLPQHGQELGIPIEVPSNGNLDLALYVIDDPKLPSGSFTGNLLLGSINQDPILIPVSYSHTSACAKFLGAIALLGGVILSFLGFQALQNLSAYLQVLLGARRLASHASSVAEAIAAGPFKSELTAMQQTLSKVSSDLSRDGTLNVNGLPSRLLATMNGIPANSLERIRSFLSGESSIIDALEYLAGPGAISIKLRAPAAQLQKELADLDAFGASVTTVQAAQLYISQQLSALPAAMVIDQNGKSIPVMSLDPRVTQVPPERPALSLREITIQLDRSSFIFLLLLGLVTWLTGLSVLVLSDPAFGGLADYAKCLLWGIGIQGIGQQLGTATAPNVRQTLTIASH